MGIEELSTQLSAELKQAQENILSRPEFAGKLKAISTIFTWDGDLDQSKLIGGVVSADPNNRNDPRIVVAMYGSVMDFIKSYFSTHYVGIINSLIQALNPKVEKPEAEEADK